MDRTNDAKATTDRSDALSTLNNLLETCRDGEQGFRTAADGVDDANLKRLFQSYAQQRAEFVAELQREVQRLGGDPADHGHAAAAAHRGWINIKSAVTGKDDHAVLAEAERGEDYAVKAYRQALDSGLSPELRMIVERQYMQVKEAHDHVRAMRDAHAHKG
ncbi:MAG TPA: PA2169 family four-helix-bundle protein [Gemmatimonadales bacterium]|nr:PA2169 family four-helix-bundle protein [Gemmatimonadales bacterium]